MWTSKSFRPLSQYDTTPSAWDVTFKSVPPTYVRIRMRDGSWFAGWFGTNSYASSYPDAQGLYVEIEYAVDIKGALAEPISGSGGSFIDCTDAVLVELLRPGAEAEQSRHPEALTDPGAQAPEPS